MAAHPQIFTQVCVLLFLSFLFSLFIKVISTESDKMSGISGFGVEELMGSATCAFPFNLSKKSNSSLSSKAALAKSAGVPSAPEGSQARTRKLWAARETFWFPPGHQPSSGLPRPKFRYRLDGTGDGDGDGDGEDGGGVGLGELAGALGTVDIGSKRKPVDDESVRLRAKRIAVEAPSKLWSDIEEYKSFDQESHTLTEAATLSNDRAINPYVVHSAMRQALLDRQEQPYKGELQEICGGPKSLCEKRVAKPTLNQLILRPENGCEPTSGVQFSTFTTIGTENSNSSVKWDFGATATPMLKFTVVVLNDTKGKYDINTYHQVPRPYVEASITFVPGLIDMDGKEDSCRCFQDNDVHYTSPEQLQGLDGDYAN